MTDEPKRGRPTSYDPEFAKQAEKLCKLGATDADLADFFGVHIRTVANWKAAHSEFLQALKAGKDEADDRVERSLYQRAVGYSCDAVKIFMPANALKPVYAEFVEHHAPDTTAAIFWLKNRRPDQWRDKATQEITGPDGGPVQIQRIELVPVAPALNDDSSS